MSDAVLEVSDLTKTYRSGGRPLTVLHDVSFGVEAGSTCAIVGPSGSGKSDLALRLINGGGILVADDRVDLMARSGTVLASAPESLFGLLEVRGLGILPFPAIKAVRLALVCDLVGEDEIERLPEGREELILNTSLALVAIAPFEYSAVLKVQLALKLAIGSIICADDE